MSSQTDDFKIGGEETSLALLPSRDDRLKAVPIYEAVVKHQRTAEWWPNRGILGWLRDRSFDLIRELDIRVAGRETLLTPPLIRVEPMNVKTIGTFHAEPDGYALAGTISFNEVRLPDLSEGLSLAYLLKFLVCAASHRAGRDGSFDKACRKAMEEKYGVIFTKGGVTIDAARTFADFLTTSGFTYSREERIPKPREGKETSKLWSCLCQRARVGTKQFSAYCPLCKTEFMLGDNVGKRFTPDHKASLAAPNV